MALRCQRYTHYIRDRHRERGRCCCIQISVFAAALTADIAVDLFVDGGNVTEEELLETTGSLFGVIAGCVMCFL